MILEVLVMKVSILMLTHNAPRYCKRSIQSIYKYTKNCNYELVVVDNMSGARTAKLLVKLKQQGYIDKLYFNSKNDLFAKGNNIAASLAANDSDYYLLLNSDVKIKSPDWLKNLEQLISKHNGIVSYGAVLSEPQRADGYCLLIDTKLYNKYKLDEDFAWWWGVTKLEGQILNEGKEVTAIENHEEYIHHYGGKSGKGYKNAIGMDVDMDEVKGWFLKGKVNII